MHCPIQIQNSKSKVRANQPNFAILRIYVASIDSRVNSGEQQHYPYRSTIHAYWLLAAPLAPRGPSLRPYGRALVVIIDTAY